MVDSTDLLKRVGEVVVSVIDQIIVNQRSLVGSGAEERLLELHLDQPAFGAELNDVALNLGGHSRNKLRALQNGEDIVECGAALELKRRHAGRNLIEPQAVLVERRERLIGLRQHGRDVLEDVLRSIDVERDDFAPL